MNCIFAETIYTGKSIVSNAYLVFNGQKISGISKTAKGQWASFICWSGPHSFAGAAIRLI